VLQQPENERIAERRKLSLTRVVLPPLLMCFLVVGLPIWYLGASGYVEPLLHPGRETGDKVVFYDWADFYGAGNLVAKGKGGQIYDDSALGPEQRRILGLWAGSKASMPFSNPPFVAAAFAPLAFLPPSIAIGFIGLTGLLLTMAAALAFERFLRPNSRLLGFIFIAGFITLWPVGNSFALGQLSMLISLTWLGFVAFQAKGHDFRAGLALALLLTKPQIAVVPLVVAVLKRRQRLLVAFAGAAAVLGAISVATYGASFVIDYPASLIARAGWDHFEFGHAQHFYGWNGLLSLAVPYGTHTHLGLLVCLDGATLGSLALAWRGKVGPGSPQFLYGSSATLLATLLVDPHLLLHDLALVALAMAFSLRAAQIEGRGERGWLWAGTWMWTVLFVAPIFQANFVTPLLALLLAINIREARRSVGANPLAAAAFEGGSSLVAAAA
jgi:hypothetical protein